MALALKRRRSHGAMISVVSLIDVLMILLIFFMVTSTYLDLDMVPAVTPSAPPPPEAAAPGALPAPDPSGTGAEAQPSVLLLRIGEGGVVQVQGRRLDPAGLSALLAARLTAEPQLQVALFPSPGADMQALVSALDAASAAGVRHLRVIRLEAGP